MMVCQFLFWVEGSCKNWRFVDFLATKYLAKGESWWCASKRQSLC